MNKLTDFNPPAIIELHSGYKAEFIKEYKVEINQKSELVNKKPINLIVDYISNQIKAIDKARKEIREKYPNFLPKIN